MKNESTLFEILDRIRKAVEAGDDWHVIIKNEAEEIATHDDSLRYRSSGLVTYTIQIVSKSPKENP